MADKVNFTRAVMERSECNPETSCCIESGPTRRSVLHAVGGGVGALLLARSGLHAFAGPFESADFEKLVPADKKLSAEWVRSLTERGAPTVYRGPALAKIGMPVGGIGAGQVYLGGDGRLWHWDVFNHVAGTGAEHYAAPPAPQSPFEQGFAVDLRPENGKAIVRSLDSRGYADITFRGEYPIAQVEYLDASLPATVSLEAFSPFIPLNTDDSSLPATVMRYTVTNTGAQKLEACVGGWMENAISLYTGQASGLLRRNHVVQGDGFTCVEYAAELPKNPEAAKSEPDILFDDFEKPAYDGWTATGTAFGNGPIEKTKIPTYQGDVGAHGARTVNSHNARNGEDVNKGDTHTGTLTSKPFTIERDYIRFLIGGGNHEGRTCINLLVDEKVVRTATGHNENHMQPETFDARPWRGKSARLQIVDAESGTWGNIGIDDILFSDAATSALTKPEEQHDFGTMSLAILREPAAVKTLRASSALPGGVVPAGLFGAEEPQTAGNDEVRPIGQQLWGAISQMLVLEPGKSASVTFVIAWHFPNLRLDNLTTEGRWYAKKFASSSAVIAFIAKEFDRLSSQTRLWRDTWYDSTLPYWFLDRTFANTSILATSTSFRFGTGRFYGWEGVGCCPGTCGHVWHYAQAVGRLFPDLERSCREMVDYRDGVGFDPKSGAIDFRAEFRNGWAADGQTGTILRVLREHQMSADDAFLKRIWPKVKQSIEFLIAQDGNGDGVLEGAQPNTLDTTWYGPISWMTSLYLAALRAGEELARDSGDEVFAKRCREIFNVGSKKIVEKCWNGEYFVHRADPNHPEAMKSGNGCEIDQVFGQSWAFQVGLGRIMSQEHVRKALASLWRYNFTPDVGPFRQKNPTGRWYAMPGEGGLLMCTWPKGDKADAQGKAPDWAFGYFNECMTGFEHQVAGHMIAEGMLTEGLSVLRAIHDRYDASRRNPWNEVECGDHYARAMASYGAFVAASGFEIHNPRGYLGFDPRINPHDFRSAFISAEGWGTYQQQLKGLAQQCAIALQHGSLKLGTLVLTFAGEKPPKGATAEVGAVKHRATVLVEGQRILLAFEQTMSLMAGDTLSVTIQS